MKRMAMQCLVGLWVCTILCGTVQAQNENGGTARVSDQPGPLPPVAETVPPAPNVADSGLPQDYFRVTPVDVVFSPRAYFTARAGTLYGYEESYTNVGAFLPAFIDDGAIVFLDGSGLVTYDGRGGANVGVGWRYLMEDIQRIVGVSAWYDFDAGHIRSYNQIGLSFESLGRYFDLRLNGYIPIGQDRNVISSTLTGNMVFAGNRLLVQRASLIETAFTGFDAEVGGPMPIFGRYGLTGYTGFYFYTANDGGDFTGVSGRLTWQLNEDASLGVQITDDGDFGTNTQLQFSMWLPDGKQGRWLRPLSLQDRLASRVIRNNRVTVEQSVQLANELGINPKDNQPYFIVHVDPNGPDGVPQGDGTVENPFNLLSQFDNLPFDTKSQVDIVLVDPRTDNTSTNLNTGVTLLSMQRLLGTTLPQTFQVAQQPGFDIPIFGITQTGTLPTLSNDAGGNVVTLADGAMMVEVSSFNINGNATGSGIVGTNNTAVMINRNVISGGVNGIQLFNLTGLAADGMESAIVRNIIRGNTQDGIFIGNAGVGPLDLIIANNPPLDVDLDGVLVDTDSNGVPDSFQPDSLDGDGDFSNDGIANNGDDGLDINADAGSFITLVMDSNVIFGNGDNGAEIDATANSTIQGLIFSNEIRDNGGNGILMTADNSTLDFLNVLAGVVDPVTGLPLQGQIRGNTIFRNAEDGLAVTTTGPSTASLAVLGNVFGADASSNDATLGNGGYGFSFSADGGSALLQIGAPDVAPVPPNPGVINGNQFGFNQVGGISIVGSGTAIIGFNIENNNVRNTATDNTPAPRAAVTFLFDGVSGTDPFVVTNLSDPGIDITSVTWDLNGTPAEFDSNNSLLGGTVANPTNAALQPTAGTDVTTGLTDINGVAVTAGLVPLRVTVGGNVVGTGVIADGSKTIGLGFNDFDPQESFTATTILSANVGPTLGSGLQQDAPFNSQAADGSRVSVTFSNGLSTTFAVTRTDPTDPNNIEIFGQAQAFGSITPGAGAGNDGIFVRAAGQATLNQAVIQNNTVTGYGGYGIRVQADNLSSIPNLVVQNNTLRFNGTGVGTGGPVFTGGGLAIERDGAANLTAFVANNTITENFNDGFTVDVSGLAVGQTVINSQDNTIQNNVMDGVQIVATGAAQLTFNSLRDNVSFNGGDNFNVQIFDNATVDLNITNTTATGAGDDGVEITVGGTAVFNFALGNVPDPSFTGSNSAFSNNADDGLVINTLESGLVVVNIDGMVFEDNGDDGIEFNRDGSSLILATIANSEITNNLDDGIEFTARGSDVRDPNTPLFNPNVANVINGQLGLAPASRLTLTNSMVIFNGVTGAPNGGNGLEVHTDDDANLVFDVSATTISNNITDGARVFSGGQSSFGNYWTGARSTFDNVEINENGRDGIKLVTMGQFDATPTHLVQVSSVGGTTTLSDNGDDGIEAAAPYGTIDLLVTGQAGGTWTTLLQRNAGMGIEFNVADVAIDGDDASDVNSNARVDGDADGAANEILDFYFPNGFEIDHPQTQGLFSGIGILNVSNVLVGDGDVNDVVDDGNGVDGISVYVSNVEQFTGFYFAGATSNINGAAGNEFDANRDLIADNVGGIGGVAINSVFFPTALAGTITMSIDSSQMAGNGNDGLYIQGDGLHVYGEEGNIINATVTNNLISSNGRHGVNIDLRGIHGSNNALDAIFSGGDYTVLTANQFLFDNNVIERNANYGFRYQANAGAIVRPQFTDRGPVSTYFWAETFQDGVQPTNPPGEFDPQFICDFTILQPIFNSTLLGFLSGNPNFDFSVLQALNDDFYSISTDLNSNLVFTNNTVQFNGTPGQGFEYDQNGGGDGMFIRNSTDSYLSADIGGAAGSGNGNVFTGNALADLRFESFTATEVDGRTAMIPQVSEGQAAPTTDLLYLDDTAQITLRFNNNFGSELDANFVVIASATAAGERGAAYAQNGSSFIGFPGNTIRTTQMFQVDDGFNLNLNNTFNTDLTNEFNVFGGWHLVPVADPAFPNPIFPQDCLQDPGDPFFQP